ncbi:hypothetical protein [Prevotella corporis]|uniref:hypothetical protein n=1 Tax=Prevotella corporis TaxID=28128 RepID=UPI0023F98CB4|nr:hypothetical protein [Prevotella corporis]
MIELRNNGHIRVVVEEYIDYLEDGNYHYKVVRLQVRASFLGFKYWVNIYTCSTDDLSDDYLESEVIDIYNKIVYPNKYFVTNANNT